MKATEFLQAAIDVQTERAKEYDSPEGERSMGRTVAAFNAVTGRDLTEAEGWLFLQTLKDVRQWSAKGYHHDSALDGVSYSSLKAEALSAGWGTLTYPVEQVLGFDPTDPGQWMSGDFLMGLTGAVFVLARVDGHFAVCDDGRKVHLSNVTWFSRPEAKPLPVPDVNRTGNPQLWKVGDVIRFEGPTGNVFVKGAEHKVANAQGRQVFLSVAEGPPHTLSFEFAAKYFEWVRRP